MSTDSWDQQDGFLRVDAEMKDLLGLHKVPLARGSTQGHPVVRNPYAIIKQPPRVLPPQRSWRRTEPEGDEGYIRVHLRPEEKAFAVHVLEAGDEEAPPRGPEPEGSLQVEEIVEEEPPSVPEDLEEVTMDVDGGVTAAPENPIHMGTVAPADLGSFGVRGPLSAATCTAAATPPWSVGLKYTEDEMMTD